MSVLDAVLSELDAVSIPQWKREVALALATSLDAAPNASTAKELRLLMDEIGTKPVEAGDVSDDLAAKRAARRAAG